MVTIPGDIIDSMDEHALSSSESKLVPAPQPGNQLLWLVGALWLLSGVGLMWLLGVRLWEVGSKVLALSVLAAGLIPFVIQWRSGQRDWFDLSVLYSFFFGLTFGLRGMFIAWEPIEVHFGPILSGDISRELTLGLAWALVGILAFQAGYYQARTASISRRTRGIRFGWQAKDRVGRLLLLYLLGVVTNVLVVQSKLSPTQGSSGLVVYLYLVRSLEVASLFMLWGAFFQSPRRQLQLGLILVVLTTLSAFLCILQTDKASWVALGLALTMSYHYFRRRISIRVLGVAILIVVLVVLPVVSAQRGYESQSVLALFNMEPTEYLQYSIRWLSYRTDSLDSFMGIFRLVPESLPYLNGQGIFGDLLNGLVPRFLWPDKPLADFGQRISILLYNNPFSNASLSVVADLYWNFGFAGILAGMLVTGFFMRLLREWLIGRQRPSDGALMMYFAVIVLMGNFSETTFATPFLSGFRAVILYFIVNAFLEAGFRNSSALTQTISLNHRQ